jgi:hypothetical protein
MRKQKCLRVDYVTFPKFGSVVVDGWRVMLLPWSLTLLNFDISEFGNRQRHGLKVKTVISGRCIYSSVSFILSRDLDISRDVMTLRALYGSLELNSF